MKKLVLLALVALLGLPVAVVAGHHEGEVKHHHHHHKHHGKHHAHEKMHCKHCRSHKDCRRREKCQHCERCTKCKYKKIHYEKNAKAKIPYHKRS